YWWSEGYKAKPLAEVLAVHPKQKAEGKAAAGQDGRHPLVLQQFVGAGRCLFFGFDDSWRWGFREDELRHNQVCDQSVRHLPRRAVARRGRTVHAPPVAPRAPSRGRGPKQAAAPPPRHPGVPGRRPGGRGGREAGGGGGGERPPAGGPGGGGGSENQAVAPP